MLDTNALSAFLNRLSPRLDGWVREQRCCLSAISEGCALVTADQAFAIVAELTLESW